MEIRVNEEEKDVDHEHIENHNAKQNCCLRYCTNMTTKKIMMILMVASILFSVATLFILSPYIRKNLNPMFNWFNPIKWKILPLIMLLYASWTILTIPAEETWAYLIGFFYGFWVGWIVVLCTAFTACCAAFLVSRYVLKQYIFQTICSKCKGKCKCCVRYQANESQVERFDEWFSYLVATHGFWAVLAIRFFILPPATWTNHIFAHTNCPFRSFAFATFIGKIFYSSMAAYVGSELKNILQVTGDAQNDPIIKYVMPAVFIGIFAIISVVIGCLSKMWLKKQKEIYDQDQAVNITSSNLNNVTPKV